MIKIKRVYDPIATDDGYRVLIDRLWPRGIKKENLAIDEWAKDLAPSSNLRKSFHQDITTKWKEFKTQYKKELSSNDVHEKLHALAQHTRHKTVTLLTSTKDQQHNYLVILKEVLEKEIGSS